jgi:hypothetical protein
MALVVLVYHQKVFWLGHVALASNPSLTLLPPLPNIGLSAAEKQQNYYAALKILESKGWL